MSGNADETIEDQIQKFASEGNMDEVLKLYNEMYPENIIEPDEGWDADLTLSQKAGFLSEIGKNDEAIKIYKTMLEMKSQESGENYSPRGVLTMKQQIGGAFLSQNKIEEALEILTEVLNKQIELLGDGINKDKSDPHDTKYMIGQCLEKQGKFQEALGSYEQAYEAYAQMFGKDTGIITDVLGFNIKSLQLKMAAEIADGALDLDAILKIVDYGPTVLSVKAYDDDSDRKDTILHRAVRTDNVDIVKVVLDEILAKFEGSEDEEKEKLQEFLNCTNSEAETPLTLAVKYDCENAVRYLLENAGEHRLDVNQVNYFGVNPLLTAKYRVNESIQKLLLEYNAVVPPSPEKN